MRREGKDVVTSASDRQGEKTPPRLRCHDLCQQYLQQAYSPPPPPPPSCEVNNDKNFYFYPSKSNPSVATLSTTPTPHSAGQNAPAYWTVCTRLFRWAADRLLTDKAVSINGQYTHAFERITQYTVTDTIHRHTSHIYGKSRSHHQVLLKRLSQRGCRSPVA